MLTTLRNSSKNSILKIIFGSLLTILIISFGMWGTEDLVGVGKKQSTVATVGKLDISAKEFYSLYSRQTEEIRKLLGSSLDIKKSREFGYVDRALSSLVNRALFNNEALELGLSVSDINVRDKILKDDAFKDDLGQFSELQFRQLISESGYSEDTYVEGTRQDLAREQMVETIRSSLTIPKIMLKKLGEYNLQERSVDYFVIDVRNEKIDKIEDQELRDFYNANKADFMSEELRNAETLLLDAKEYAKKSTVTSDEVELLYEERKEALIEPEERFLYQILVDSDQKSKSIANKINPKNFEAIAKKDLGLNKEDINLGWNTKSELPEEIVDDIFNLKEGEISIPLQSGFGWHIIYVSKIKERKEVKFEEVKNKFRNEILFEKGKDAVYDLQDELEDLLASGSSFDEISKILEVKILKSNLIKRNGEFVNGKKEKFKDERILRTIFNQKLNEEGNIIDTDGDEGLAISLVTEIIPPKQLSFEESKNKILEMITLRNQTNKALKKAEKIKNKVDSKKITFNNQAKKLNLEIKGVQPFSRILPDSSVLPIPLISKIFESKIKDVNYVKRGQTEVIVAQTAEIKNDLVNDKSELKEFEIKLKDDLTIDLLAQFSEALRKKYKITINDDVIDQLN
jgi:peptidyl-prolyl cis-trans isomerase D